MGRAIVREPRVFLMDEPLSNLDAKLRVQMRSQIASLQSRLGVTTVYVTHDQTEALTMGDRIAVLKDGHLQQVDSPSVMYSRPANVFVAGFIGSPAMNLVEAEKMESGAVFGDAIIPVPRTALRASSGNTITVGIRPEDLRLGEHGVRLRVELVEVLGADTFVHGRLADAPEAELVVVRVPTESAPSKGETVRAHPDPERIHLFDAETGIRL